MDYLTLAYFYRNVSLSCGAMAPTTVAMVSDFFYPNSGGVESHIFQVVVTKEFKNLISQCYQTFSAIPVSA